MTRQEIQDELVKLGGITSGAHEGAEIAHYAAECRQCVIEHFMGLERERIAKKFEDAAELLPLGAEDPQKGQSIYNWLRFAAEKVRLGKV